MQRSESLSGPDGDSGSRDPLLPGDAWTEPPEHVFPLPQITRRILGVAELLLLLAVFGLGIYLLLSPELLQQNPQLWWFTVVVLSGDAAVLTFVGLSLALIRICCGDNSVQYALAGCSLLLHALQAICCYVATGAGFYFLVVHGRLLLYENPVLLLFIVLEVILATAWSIETCPTVVGTCGFVIAKVEHILSARPVVTFQDPAHDYLPSYAHWQEYRQSLARIVPPAAKAPPASLASAQVRISSSPAVVSNFQMPITGLNPVPYSSDRLSEGELNTKRPTEKLHKLEMVTQAL